MRILHRLLLLLPPETAHLLAKWGLRLLQWNRFKLRKQAFHAQYAIHLPQVPNLKFGARAGVAAGLDKNADFYAALGLLGAGFVEVGTVTPLPQTGNAKPRLWRPAPGTLINHMGFNSVGLEAFRRNLKNYRSQIPGVPLFANIGKNRQTPIEDALTDYEKCFAGLVGCVDGFVVNLSSPNTPGLVGLQSESFVCAIAERVPKGTPVLLKLSPDLENSVISDLGRLVAAESRLAGLVVTNTSREMAQEVFGWEKGGLSGRPLFSRALECVSLARQALGENKLLIGVGGVGDLASARQMRKAGADLVEVYTALVYQGPSLLKALSSLE